MSLHELYLVDKSCHPSKYVVNELLYSKYNSWRQLVLIYQRMCKKLSIIENVLILFSIFLLYVG
jgi:hypothetical protein